MAGHRPYCNVFYLITFGATQVSTFKPYFTLFSFVFFQNSWRCNPKSSTQHLLQTEHLRLLLLRRPKRDRHRRELLSLRRLPGPSDGHLQRPRLPHEVHRILERKSQVLFGYLRWIGSIFKVQVCCDIIRKIHGDNYCNFMLKWIVWV